MNAKSKKTPSKKKLEPIRGKVGATILGPTNPAREAQNPDVLGPPRTDHGLNLEACGNCIGIPMPMNGNFTFQGKHA